MWNNAIVTFFRAFNTSVRNFKLDKEMLSDLQGEPLKVFNFFENLRNRHIAHSVNKCEYVEICCCWDENYNFLNIVPFDLRRVGEDEEQIKNLLDFAKHIIKKLFIDEEIEIFRIVNWAKKCNKEEIDNMEKFSYTIPDPIDEAKNRR